MAAPDITALATLREELGAVPDGHNILLLGPFGSLAVDAVGGSLLSQGAPETTQYLCVTYDDTPWEQIEDWRDHVGQLPNTTSMVTTSQEPRDNNEVPASVKVEDVPDARELSRLGITISQTLETDEDNTVCCFDSITELLHYATLERSYRFLHTLKHQLSAHDAVSHYHLDPSAHENGTIETLRPLFDLIVAVEKDGSVEIR